MKKSLLAVCAVLCLAGCGGSDYYNNNRETRYFAYVGEPVAVLYDNFGTPAKGIKYSDTERALVFHTQDFEREWAYVDYRYCDITFYLKDDVVTGWQMDGNQCAINEEDTGFSFFGGSNNNNTSGVPHIADDAFDNSIPFIGSGSESEFDSEDFESTFTPEVEAEPFGGHVIADDAF